MESETELEVKNDIIYDLQKVKTLTELLTQVILAEQEQGNKGLFNHEGIVFLSEMIAEKTADAQAKLANI